MTQMNLSIEEEQTHRHGDRFLVAKREGVE